MTYMATLNNRNKMILQAGGFLLSLCLLLFFFLFIDPSNRSLVFVFIPVVLFWLLLFFLSQMLIGLFVRRNKRLFTILAIIAVSTVVLLILLSGIGQLSVVDIVLTTCLCIVCSFYFYRSWDL